MPVASHHSPFSLLPFSFQTSTLQKSRWRLESLHSFQKNPKTAFVICAKWKARRKEKLLSTSVGRSRRQMALRCPLFRVILDCYWPVGTRYFYSTSLRQSMLFAYNWHTTTFYLTTAFRSCPTAPFRIAPGRYCGKSMLMVVW